jgi:AbiV family abortive infection protein
MSSKTFLTISKKECLIVYKNILENSDRKWESGKNLAKINDFGGATSMAIISVEEMIKAIVVLLDGKGFEFRNVKGMDVVFNHHQIRYLIAYAMFVMSLLGDELLKFLTRIRENPDEMIKIEEAMKQNEEEFFERNLKHYCFRKLIQLKKEFDWFSQVDIFRQDGFYCGYEEQLKNPISIDSCDYEKVINRLEKVRKVGKELIISFENQEVNFTKPFLRLKKDFKQKKYYKHIEKSLATVRQSRESPFDLIKKKFPKI